MYDKQVVRKAFIADYGDIIFNTFKGIRQIQISLMEDPENTGSWICINVGVEKYSSKEILAMYDCCVEKIVERIPSEIREKVCVTIEQ